MVFLLHIVCHTNCLGFTIRWDSNNTSEILQGIQSFVILIN